MYSKLIPPECHEMKLRLDLFWGIVLCPAFRILSQTEYGCTLYSFSNIALREMAKESTNRKNILVIFGSYIF